MLVPTVVFVEVLARTKSVRQAQIAFLRQLRIDRGSRRYRRILLSRHAGRCWRCGYDIRGVAVCPECGEAMAP